MNYRFFSSASPSGFESLSTHNSSSRNSNIHDDQDIYYYLDQIFPSIGGISYLFDTFANSFIDNRNLSNNIIRRNINNTRSNMNNINNTRHNMNDMNSTNEKKEINDELIEKLPKFTYVLWRKD